jgi:thrombospondin type 3 repeat protein
VKVTSAGPTLFFSAAAAGLAPGTNVDAVGIESSGNLLLSFDTTVKLGSLTIAPEDVVSVNPSTFAAALVYDGSARGIAPGLNLDAVSRRSDTGHLLLSFDGAGTAGGVSFTARDVLDWNPSTNAYALVYRGATAGWPDGPNLDEVSGIPTDADGDSLPWSVDNCPYVANPSQSDVGGVKASPPDGIGDACQCGEVNNDGRVTQADLAAIRAGLTGTTSGVLAPERCSVIGGVSATLLATGMRTDCNEADAVVIRRALSGLGPGIAQVCKPAVP